MGMAASPQHRNGRVLGCIRIHVQVCNHGETCRRWLVVRRRPSLILSSIAQCTWPCLMPASYPSIPSSRMPLFSRFTFSSWRRTVWCTHSTETHGSYIQNSHPCIQPNKISYRTKPTKTTKYDWMHSLNMHLNVLNRLSVLALLRWTNQSHP